MTTASTFYRKELKTNYLLLTLVSVFSIFWISTLVGTTDIKNWLLENALVFIFVGSLAISYRKFKFSDTSYSMIFIYLLLHIYGAKYTYSENPFGYWLQDTFNTSRNHYDRIVHFSFGLMLAYPMRDFFMNYFRFPVWVCWVLPVEITLSFSALYELIEWAVADLFFPAQGMAYLGTQGDIWDAQKDIFLAFCGSVAIMLGAFLIKKFFFKKKPDHVIE